MTETTLFYIKQMEHYDFVVVVVFVIVTTFTSTFITVEKSIVLKTKIEQ